MSTMTSPSSSLDVPYDGWTTETLPDVEFRYELVDGALLVTPPPLFPHVVIANELMVLLRDQVPAGWRPAIDPGVYFDLRNYREPDLVVYRRAAVAQARLTPGDVLLAVEVMSASSVSTDRLVKPAQYAAAGIAGYWRIEQDPLTVITYELVGDAYRETGRFTDEVEVSAPFPATFRVADLLDPAGP